MAAIARKIGVTVVPPSPEDLDIEAIAQDFLDFGDQTFWSEDEEPERNLTDSFIDGAGGLVELDVIV